MTLLLCIGKNFNDFLCLIMVWFTFASIIWGYGAKCMVYIKSKSCNTISTSQIIIKQSCIWVISTPLLHVLLPPYIIDQAVHTGSHHVLKKDRPIHLSTKNMHCICIL